MSWNNPNGSRLTEEFDGKLWVEAHPPLERALDRPLEIHVTHLVFNPLGEKPRVTGAARLVGCSVGVYPDEETTFLLAFHCFDDGGDRIIVGVRQPDVDRDAWFPDEWWVQCHVSADTFARLQNARSLTIVCTTDMWALGRDWRLGRPGVATPGRGRITRFEMR